MRRASSSLVILVVATVDPLPVRKKCHPDADEHAAQTVVGDVSWLGGHEIERCGF
jgi:hypothetical protein